MQALLNNTIQSHGSYVAHLTDALSASGAEIWRITPNVDAAFPYDLSYDAGDRAAANRTEAAALLAVSILTSVRERLVAVSCDICLGVKQLADSLTVFLPCVWPWLAAAYAWNVSSQRIQGLEGRRSCWCCDTGWKF